MHSGDTQFSSAQLFWVGVIAAVAAFLTTWFSTQSVPQTAVVVALSAAISVAIVWFVGWTRRAR